MRCDMSRNPPPPRTSPGGGYPHTEIPGHQPAENARKGDGSDDANSRQFAQYENRLHALEREVAELKASIADLQAS